MSRFDWDRVRRERGLDRPWSPDIEGRELAEHERQRREADAQKAQKARDRAARRTQQPGRSKKRKQPRDRRGSSVNTGRQAARSRPESLEATSIAPPTSTGELRDATRLAVTATSWRAFEDWLVRRQVGVGHLVFAAEDALLAVSREGDNLVLRLATSDRGRTVEGLPGTWSELARAPHARRDGPARMAAAVREAESARNPRQLRWVRVAP